MSVKRAVSIILCVFICLALVSCKKTDEGTSSSEIYSNSGDIQSEEISLIYYSGDSFNPYTAKTRYNRQISRLLYDPLVKCDNSFNPVLCLAASADLQGRVCVVTLNTAYFTDGSPVTSNDVVYSYNLARKSETVYAASLYEVSSIATSGNSVIFNLIWADPYFLNLLDFPIIKSGSDGQKNSDGVEVSPIGSGRYYFNQNENTLLPNDGYFGQKSEVSKISLINAPDEASASHYVEIGAADMYYADESAASITRMSGKRADVNTNNFVYIGINTSYGQLSNALTRYAISSAINRSEICHNAFFDNAVAASGFINPQIKETLAVQSLKTVSDTEITVENLDKMGYNILDRGYYCNDSGNHLSFTLLVNSDNSSAEAAAKLIANQCRIAGIEINVTECGYEQYMALLASGNFQLYLGEIRVLPNMDMSSLVVPGGSAAYGVSQMINENGEQSTACETIVARYRAGECTLADEAGVFLTEMPQIPLCYKKGILFYTSRIKNMASPSLSDIFFSFENYKF